MFNGVSLVYLTCKWCDSIWIRGIGMGLENITEYWRQGLSNKTYSWSMKRKNLVR